MTNQIIKDNLEKTLKVTSEKLVENNLSELETMVASLDKVAETIGFDLNEEDLEKFYGLVIDMQEKATEYNENNIDSEMWPSPEDTYGKSGLL